MKEGRSCIVGLSSWKPPSIEGEGVLHKKTVRKAFQMKL